MINKIVAQIKANSRVSDFIVSETRKSGLEWYFVKADLDSARSIETALYNVSIYVDSGEKDNRKRGLCSVLLHPNASDDEIGQALDRAVKTAAGMGNPWYPLPEKSTEKPLSMDSNFRAMSLGEAMEKIRKALYAPDQLDGATINSLEIFLSRQDTRLVTSRGIDETWSSYKGFAEFVVNAGTRGKDEVELYSDINFSTFDEARLSSATRTQLVAARDRLRAVATPVCEGIPLLLAGELAAQVYGYWFENVQASAVYEKTANLAVGDTVGLAGGPGDIVGMKAVPMVTGSPQGGPYDATGFLLKPVQCILDDKVTALVAPMKYAHYLKCPVTGGLTLFEVEPGKRSQKDLRAADHLEVLTFSDFFVDGTTGDFGGEIRLAYLVKNGVRTPVRGGSVTGSISDNRGKISLSSELEITVTAKAPSVCVLPKVSITAAD